MKVTKTDNSFWVSADTLTAFAIAIIQDMHTTVYDQFCTYYQTAHNQATLETPNKAKQLMNSHYNIVLLANNEQLVNAVTPTKSQPAPDSLGTDANQMRLKTLITTKVLHSLSITADTDQNGKPSVTGCALPIQ